MDTDILDTFCIADVGIEANPRTSELAGLPALKPSSVRNRHDAFLNHRDKISRNIVGINFSWSSPATMLYDWYQSSSGMTVGLETLSTLSRVRSSLITIRVRHQNPDIDLSILRTGRTFSFHPSDEVSSSIRYAILDAIDEGISPLWRLRTAASLPDWVSKALCEPMSCWEKTGHLDKEVTRLFLATGFVTEEEILDALGARRSSYRRRGQS